MVNGILVIFPVVYQLHEYMFDALQETFSYGLKSNIKNTTNPTSHCSLNNQKGLPLNNKKIFNFLPKMNIISPFHSRFTIHHTTNNNQRSIPDIQINFLVKYHHVLVITIYLTREQVKKVLIRAVNSCFSTPHISIAPDVNRHST